MRKKSIYLIIIIIACSSIFNGCRAVRGFESPPGAVFNRELNDKEMELPNMRIDVFSSASYTYYLDYPPPEKPSVDWTKSLYKCHDAICHVNVDQIIVDNEGSTWYEINYLVPILIK